MAEFVTPADVRAYLQASENVGQWSNSLIGSNIAAASGNLQRWTGRQFEAQSNTRKVFTTHGAAYVTIPDLRSTSEITLQGTTLEAESTYYLVPDRMNTGVYTGVQFRAFGAYDYRSNPEWFDRNLDNPRWGRDHYSLPNDLVITGTWGHVPIPAEVQHATIVLAAYYVLRSDALLSGQLARLEQGVVLDYSNLPIEVQNFVETWRLGPVMAAV